MDDNRQPDGNVAQYNGKIIAASLGMLCLVVFFIFALHIYARWFWRVSARRQAFLWRGRSGEQAGGEPVASASEGGLDKALVDAMPTFLYHAGHAGQDCAVCLCEFQENEKGRLLPNCKHSFHTGCIDAWFLSHTTCPLCRAGAAPPSPSPSPSSFLCSNGGPESALQATQDEQAQDPQQAREPEETQPDLEANLRGEEEGPGLPQPSSSLPSSGWRWAGFSRSHHAVQFPTNVLFWGDHSHVTSRVSSPTLQHGQRGGRSLPHTLAMTLDPTRAQGSYGAEQSPAPDLRQQEDPLSKFPVARLSAIKRLLSCRERRVFPSSSSEQEAPSTSIDLRA